jgi:hypothetical protein
LLNSLKSVGANKQASVALENLRQWTRKKERALELGLVLSDPSLLYAALEEVSGQVKQETSVLKLAMARIELELETNPTYESVETYRQMLEAELQTLSLKEGALEKKGGVVKGLNAPADTTSTWRPKTDGEKGKESKGEKGGGKAPAAWKEPCKFFENESGCRFGRQCNGYHRRATPLVWELRRQ